jgi:uroporphyrinogen decarboxylase
MTVLMTPRQRLKTVLAGHIPDRVPVVDISFWPETLERWRKEGLPSGITPADHFALDCIERFSFDGSLCLSAEIIEESEQWRVRRDANGVLIKEWRDWHISYSPPVRLDCLVKTWDDWLKVKSRLRVSPHRITEQQVQTYDEWRHEDRLVVISPVEPMWFLIEQLTGFEVGLPMAIEQPDLAADILNAYTDFILGMCQLAVDEGMTFDALWFFSDLCYRNGMLFSPKVYRELLMPCHRRVKAWCETEGMPLMLHCDGDMREFIPLLIEVGFDVVQPLEARCGNDVRELKPLYGTDIAFFGNISADVMAYGSDAEIEEEIVTKLRAAKEGGGYIYHSDHSIPPTVSLQRYEQVIALVRQHGQYDS